MVSHLHNNYLIRGRIRGASLVSAMSVLISENLASRLAGQHRMSKEGRFKRARTLADADNHKNR